MRVSGRRGKTFKTGGTARNLHRRMVGAGTRERHVLHLFFHEQSGDMFCLSLLTASAVHVLNFSGRRLRLDVVCTCSLWALQHPRQRKC